MNFEFTDEQKLFAELVRRFARENLAAGALKRAHDPGFPYDIAQLMAKQGLMGIALPESDGGQGGTLMDAVIAIEQVAAVCPRSADVVQFGNFGPVRTFAEYATEAQKKRWLGELLAGRMVMSLGMTEPDAGSAVTDLKPARGRWLALYRQRQQGVFHLQPGCADFSGLCAFRSRCRRHRLGADRARSARIYHWRAIAIHEWRGMERTAFRGLPNPGVAGLSMLIRQHCERLERRQSSGRNEPRDL